MSKVKWGILGTANIASWGMIPGMKLADNCELYAIAGRSKQKADDYREKFGFDKAYYSYDELLADRDVAAVYIPLPNDLHMEWVLKSLKAGKHVLCEKPMAMNAAQSRQMFDTAEECGVHLMEAYAYLHSPYVKSLKETISSGAIGDIYYIETAFVTQGYKEDIRLHKERGGGEMYDLGCYCTTMILSLIDSNPEYVRASAEFSELGVDSMTAGIIRFENGVRASFNVGMILGENSDARFDRLYIHGTRGTIRSDAEYNQSGEVSYRIITPEGEEVKSVSAPNNYSLEVTQFGNCILNGEKPYVSRDFSVRNAELIDSVLSDIGY